MTLRTVTTCALLSAALAAMAHAADPLPSFDADPAGTSVSGLSSGAYMAGQFHVAFSGELVGAGIVAGGPYDCAETSLAFALQRCMATNLGTPDPTRLVARAGDRASRGEIDDLDGLADDRIYIFSGTSDTTVTAPVVATVDDFYRKAGVPSDQIAVVDTMAAGHAFITEAEGNACALTGSPFVNDCDYDQAGAILTQIYGPLQPPSTAPSGTLVEFDQTEFLADPTAHGLATSGFAWVPEACEAGGCRVHVVFHGCKQTEGSVGDAVIRRTGFNRWADTNRLIVLYPQAHVTGSNPNGCWDWWGYDDAAYATRDGRQMAAVKDMIVRVSGGTTPGGGAPFCARFATSNAAHWTAGRARMCDWWFLCAVGSGERLGFAVSSSTLFEHPQGNFTTAACAI